MTTQHSDTPSPVDLPAALKRTMGDAGFLRQMLDAFSDSLDAQLATISAALDSHDSAAVAAAAHKLKGTALNLSASGIADSALRLESAGRAGRLGEDGDALARLQQACDSFKTYLAAVDWTAIAPSEE